MADSLKTLRKPCTSCPYRKDHPPGVWAKEEYEKLRDYDDNTAYGIFLCHQTNASGVPTACKGWTTVAQDSVAVRMGIAKGTLDPKEVYADCGVELHASGNAAADAGEAKIKRPPREAKAMINRLIKKGAGHA